MRETLSKWNPPLFRSGSCEIFNYYEVCGQTWTFELALVWNGAELAPSDQTQVFSKQDGDSCETLTLGPLVDGAFSVAYEGHLVLTDDVRDTKWSADLSPYQGTGHPYLGMWGVSNRHSSFTSTAEKRLLRRQLRTARWEAFWTFVMFGVALTVLGAIAVFMFR